MKLLCRKNGSIIALKGNPILSDEDLEQYQKPLSEVLKYKGVDLANSLMLSIEVPQRCINLENSVFTNNLNCPFQTPVIAKGEILVNNFKNIADEIIPPFASKIGIQIKRADHIYRVSYNETENCIDYFNQQGEEEEGVGCAHVIGNEITINNEVLIYSEKDYSLIRSSEQKVLERMHQQNAEPISRTEAEELTLDELPDKEYFLFKIFLENHKRNAEIPKSLIHEIKHIRTAFSLENRSQKINTKRLQIADMLRCEIDDEKTAGLEETFSSINTYLEKGDYKDYSAFGESEKWLVSLISNKSPIEINEILGNHKAIVKAAGYLWNKKRFPEYKQQVEKVGLYNIRRAPLSPSEDKDRSEYILRHSMMYSFSLFNPQTKKYEQKDLSAFADTEIEIEKVFATTINLGKNIMKKRLQARREGIENGELDPELVHEAKVLAGRIILPRSVNGFQVPPSENTSLNLSYNLLTNNVILSKNKEA